MKRLLFLISYLLSCAPLLSQDFESVLEESTHQWLCGKLEQAHPELFLQDDCPPKFNEFIPPKADSDINLGIEVDADSQNAILSSLLRNDCKRFIHIKALSDLYFPLFSKKLEAYELNDDYKYVPLVVSGLNASYAGAYGRSGLWQLDFAIARKAGLEISNHIDERNIADISTDVALAQLKVLSERYEDDPISILTAYFSSVAHLEKLKEGKELRGAELYSNLDDNSKSNIDAFYVTMRVFKNFELESKLSKYLQILNSYGNVNSSDSISFDAMKNLLNIPIEELKGANPTYTASILPGNYRGVPFIIPSDKVEGFNSLRDSLVSTTKQLKAPRKKPAPVKVEGDAITHIVVSGDVLGVIAEEYGVRPSEIRAWNNLRGDMIYIGQKLTIYTNKKVEPTPKVSTPRNTTITPNTGFEIYTVKSGDNLWLIAKQYPGVSAQNIMDWNGIDENLSPGQELKIYLHK